MKVVRKHTVNANYSASNECINIYIHTYEK